MGHIPSTLQPDKIAVRNRKLMLVRESDWYRDGTLAEYVAVDARNLAPLPGAVDFTVGAALVMPGLTAWQGLFDHGRLRAGQSVVVHGAAGVVGSMASQLAREGR